MLTLSKQLLRLQRLLSAGVISEDEYKQAVRERSGALMRQNGRIAKRELSSVVRKEHRGVISESRVNGVTTADVRSITGKQPEAVQRGMSRSVKIYDGKPCAEIVARDKAIKLYPRAFIKVVKGCGQR